MKQLASINKIKLVEDVELAKKSLVISIDRKRAQNVLQNLVINTINQTNEGGKIIIQISELNKDRENTVLKFVLINDDKSVEAAQRRFNSMLDCSNDSQESEANTREKLIMRLFLCNQSIKKLGGSMEVLS